MTEFTHLAELYGFRCYYNIHTNEVQGTNWFNDYMIELFLYLAVHVFEHEGFRLKIIKEL